MKISPDYQFNVLQEEEFKQQMDVISGKLETCRTEGTFAGFDDRPIYYEYFQAEGSRGAVVVVHGLSEFTGKYHEFAWYLLNQGYDVFLYDQRSHGRSCRMTDHMGLIHVDHFWDYQKDLHLFVTNVVRKVTDLPLYLYGHSMGGAITATYLAEHPDVFKKAVMSAPMIQPLTGGVNPIVARLGLFGLILLGRGKKKFWGCGEFEPDYPFERSHDKSRARFDRNMVIRLSDPCYQTTPMSLRWVQQSIILRNKLMRNSFMKKIRTPILMICAEKDDVVCQQAQVDFAEKCPVCTAVVVANGTHSMLCGTAENVRDHVNYVLEHFR